MVGCEKTVVQNNRKPPNTKFLKPCLFIHLNAFINSNDRLVHDKSLYLLPPTGNSFLDDKKLKIK
jgi:hypothetical protein